jgi:hypothetical protein
MHPTQNTDLRLRLACAACAVITTTVLGLCIHALSRNYDVAAERQAAARQVVVAQAHPR